MCKIYLSKQIKRQPNVNERYGKWINTSFLSFEIYCKLIKARNCYYKIPKNDF